MSEMPGYVEKILRDFYREQAVDEHRAQIATWPKVGRLSHAILVGWRCPACVAFKRRAKP